MAGSARAARKLARAKVAQTASVALSKKAVGYVRVSTEEQATKGFGLENQTEAITAFARSQGYDLLDIVSDPGISGAVKPSARPGFASILDRSDFSVLLVWKFDRMSRNLRDAINTVHEDLHTRGVELRSVTEAAIDTGSPMGRMIFAIFAGMAEGERETINLRTSGGRLAKARKGGFASGRVPYGYRRAPGGKMTVHEAEARVVRLIFDLREDGLILQAIADRLNREAMLSPQGSIWRPGTVAAVLDNQKYRGALEWLFERDGQIEHVLVPGTHEAII